MTNNLIAQKLCILVFQSQTVILLIFVPLLQLDYHVDRLCVLYTLYTEQGLYINDSDTAKLNEMTGNIRAEPTEVSSLTARISQRHRSPDGDRA